MFNFSFFHIPLLICYFIRDHLELFKQDFCQDGVPNSTTAMIDFICLTSQFTEKEAIAYAKDHRRNKDKKGISKMKSNFKYFKKIEFIKRVDDTHYTLNLNFQPKNQK